MGRKKKILTVSKEDIKYNLQHNTTWMERALVVLHNLQTTEEQVVDTTIEFNGKGFNGLDAKYLSYCAKWIKGGGHLNEKHKVMCGKKLPKYWNQISKIIENKVIQ